MDYGHGRGRYLGTSTTTGKQIICTLALAETEMIYMGAPCITTTGAALAFVSASEMTYIVSSGALNSTHSLTGIRRASRPSLSLKMAAMRSIMRNKLLAQRAQVFCAITILCDKADDFRQISEYFAYF